MQIANALNNQIRILFNPVVETFKLFDFLIVKSNEDRYLAQIIEIYDDRFDSSQNVAKLKLFYKISNENEVIPYDNFTPNKECEISRIKQDEVEEFINNGKKTFPFGINVKNSLPLNLQYEFFNNKAIILADKIDNANAISITLAKQLSNERNVIIIDSTGVLEHQGIAKIKSCEDFKIPLNYTTIDYIFEKCLEDASLEFQAISSDILNEIKKFARSQEFGFIPFNVFVKVLMAQYKATPYPELKILISKIKKFQMDNVFARTKADVENLKKAINENKITIIDISNSSLIWQKAYLEYISDIIEEEVYLLTRINDENCDIDLINKIYNKKKNIHFIPNVSYIYKKLPTIIQYCNNYVLLPSLYQRNDFLDANFALCNLIADGCIVFGEDTDGFLYLVKNYESQAQEERKIYRKIALSLLDEEEKEFNTNNIENSESQKDYFEEHFAQKEKIIPEQNSTNDEFQNLTDKEITKQEPSSEEEPQQIAQPIQEEQEPVESPEEEIQQSETFEEIKEEPKLTLNDEKIEEEIIDLGTSEDSYFNHRDERFETKKDMQKEIETIDLLDNQTNENLEEIETDLSEDDLDFFQIAKESSELIENKKIETDKQKLTHTIVNDVIVDEVQYKTQNDETDNIKKEEIENSLNENSEDEPVEEISEITDTQTQTETDTVEEIKEEKAETATEEEATAEDSSQELIIDDDLIDDTDVDLDAVAQSSIDESFNQILETTTVEESQTINFSDGAEINLDNLKESDSNKESLPIFKEKQDSTPQQEYKIGDIVTHSKYGTGEVIKTMRYENRQLLQIDFKEAGKKLLDPKIANVKLIQQ